MHDGLMFGAGFGWLLWLLVIGLVIRAVVTLTGGGRGGAGSSGGSDRSALDILEERYARGEIDREEYEQKRADLRR